MSHRRILFTLAVAVTAMIHAEAAPTDNPKTVHRVTRIVGKAFLSETVRISPTAR